MILPMFALILAPSGWFANVPNMLNVAPQDEMPIVGLYNLTGLSWNIGFTLSLQSKMDSS
jgi:hypothetical protein